jgi:cell division septation protein DedD
MRFFRFKSSVESAGHIPSLPPLSPEQETQRRARHRLFGMLLLVVITLVAVPWVLDQTPRPIPADLLIDMSVPQAKVAKVSKGQEDKTAEQLGEAQTETEAYLTQVSEPNKWNASNVDKRAIMTRSSAATVSPVTHPTQQPEQLKQLNGLMPAQNPAYVLQLGAFSEGNKAKALRRKLAQAGFKSSVQTFAQADGTHLLRVRIGPIETKERAKELISQLEKRGFSPVLLPF